MLQHPYAKLNRQHSPHMALRVDNYYWLNDYFKKGPDSTKVVNYLKAENVLRHDVVWK
jgi:protease II